MIEAVETEILRPRDGKSRIFTITFEKELVDSIVSYLGVQHKLGD